MREIGDEGAPRFIADAMLARLAQWLRILGFDCAHEDRIDDEQLVRRALEERRVILTCDTSLPDEWRILGIHLVAAKTPLGQLREVVTEFKLAAAAPLVRTTSAAVLEQAPEQVPQRVLQTQDELWRCPDCERVYWEGSHTDQMREVVDRIIEEQPR
ncbi:MAG: hypothetical protein JRF63_16495 [Deltaproteobacteria bacterium]|nr:hypothetical protein [Deltaproteobacteria bacterium]